MPTPATQQIPAWLKFNPLIILIAFMLNVAALSLLLVHCVLLGLTGTMAPKNLCFQVAAMAAAFVVELFAALSFFVETHDNSKIITNIVALILLPMEALLYGTDIIMYYIFGQHADAQLLHRNALLPAYDKTLTIFNNSCSPSANPELSVHNMYSICHLLPDTSSLGTQHG